MKYVVIGVKKSEGVYNEKPFSNYVFYFADKDEKNVLVGVVPLYNFEKKRLITYKHKSDEWDKDIEPKDFYGMDVNLLFDAHGNVVSMDLI